MSATKKLTKRLQAKTGKPGGSAHDRRKARRKAGMVEPRPGIVVRGEEG